MQPFSAVLRASVAFSLFLTISAWAWSDGAIWLSRPTDQPVRTTVAHAHTQALLALRVGEYRFLIPRPYFRDLPHPSGVDTGFYLRALWPGMGAETSANRAAFRASVRTEDGQRVLQIVLVPSHPSMPPEVARWMLENTSSGPGRADAGRRDLEDFSPPSAGTFDLHARLGQPNPTTTRIDNDLFHGALSDGRFVGMQCGRDPRPDWPTSCWLWFDWRPGAWLQVRFLRTRLPEWRAIAEATLDLVQDFASDREKQ